MSNTSHQHSNLPLNHPKYPHTPASYAFKMLMDMPENERPPLKHAECYTIDMDKQQLIMIEYALKLAMDTNPAIKNIFDQYDMPVVENLHKMFEQLINEPYQPNMIHGFCL